jgi:hypothetical protein
VDHGFLFQNGKQWRLLYPQVLYKIWTLRTHTIPEVLFKSGNRRTLIYIRLRDEKRWGFIDEKRHLGLGFRKGDENAFRARL